MSVSEKPATAAPPDRSAPSVDQVWRRRRTGDHLRLVQIGVVTAILCALPLFATDDYQFTVLGLMMIYAIAGVGFYLILGLSGQFAFSHAATMGIGAYSAAYAARTHGFWLSLLFALVVCAVLAAIFKLLLWRASDFYFGIATLGLASVTIIVFRAWEWFTGPASNTSMLTAPTIFGHQVTTPAGYYALFVVFFVVAMLIVYRLRTSATYREAIAVRDKPLTAAGLGIRNTRNQLVIFVVGSCYAAVAGALYAQSQGFISSPSFDLNLGINLFVVVIVGGMHSMWGSLLGAAFVVVLPELIRPAADHRQLILAAVLVLTIVLLPEGLMGLARPLTKRLGQALGRGRNRKEVAP